MKIDKKLLDDHQVELTVEVKAERMEASKRRAARQLAKRGKIPGFRPGKAPYNVILQQFGEAVVVEQAMDLLIDEIYPEILEEAEIEPAAAGSLEKVEDLDPPKLVFRVPLAPEVDLGDYRSIRLPYKWAAPGKNELDQALDEIRQVYATTETVERPAVLGDYVLVDVKGERAAPKEEEEGHPDVLSRTGYALVVSKKDKDDVWPYPGFSQELVGLNPGESKTVKHKYPKDDPDESLQGETVNFEVTMKTVRSMTLPELDDDFAKTAGPGQFETLDDLKESLKADLESRSQAEYDDEYYVELIDKIKKGSTIKYPPQVVEHEANHIIEDLGNRLSQQGLDLETYFKMQQTDRDKFMEEEARPIAIKRLERSLIMDELAKQENIKLEEGDLQSEYGQTLNELQYQGLNLGDIKGGRQGQQQFAEAVAMQSASRLMTRRTLERMKAIATGEHKEEPEAEEKKPPAKKTKSASKGKKAGKSPSKSTAKKTAAAKKKSAKKSTKKTPAKKPTKKSGSKRAE